MVVVVGGMVVVVGEIVVAEVVVVVVAGACVVVGAGVLGVGVIAAPVVLGILSALRLVHPEPRPRTKAATVATAAQLRRNELIPTS